MADGEISKNYNCCTYLLSEKCTLHTHNQFHPPSYDDDVGVNNRDPGQVNHIQLN